MKYKRQQFNDILSRINEERHHIQVIMGPRQVGKSTLIAQVLEVIDIPFESVSTDDVPIADASWLANIWEAQRLKMANQQEAKRLLVVDEVQKINNWSETVKAEWDRDTRENRNLIVVLLGSSRMLIQKGLTESLMGRFELIRVPHWTFTEMHDCFGWTLQQYVFFGGYPGAAKYIDNENRWRDYVRDSLVEPTISRDVLLDNRIQKPQLFRQLFEIGSTYSGEELSLRKIAAQLQDAGNVTTLAGYLHLLDECGLLSGLQKYAHDTARKYNSVPKFQVQNNALRNAYLTDSFLSVVEDPKAWGRCVESAVGAYLVSQAALHHYSVFYWRENNDEVDYVLVNGRKVVAIEVKSGRRQMNKGIVTFKERFNPHRSLVVGADAFPLEDFLTMDLSILFA